MHYWARVTILLFLLAVVCREGVSAQQFGTNPPAGDLPGFPQPGQTEGQDDPGSGAKEEKPPRVRKPLESFFFNDSIRALENFAWNIYMGSNNIKIFSIDTTLNDFHLDYPYLQDDVGSAYLGNLGGAAIPLNYFTRPSYRDFEFAQSYDVYFYTPERAPFYNVKKPFTQLSYFTSGQKKYNEEFLHVTHAQNISPSSGFNVNYKTRGTRGIYAWQRARAKNLSLGFSHTGKKYTAHAGYIYNASILRENGGVDEWFITDTIMELPENVPVNLRSATNTIRNNAFYMMHSYGVPLGGLSDDEFTIADRSTLFFGLSTLYSRFNKIYEDTKEGSGDFYENWFINSQASHDSIFESLLSNRAFIQIQPWSRDAAIGLIDGGVGMDIHRYYQFLIDDYLTGPGETRNSTSYYAYGSLRGKLLKFADWRADLKIHPAGDRQGDLEFGGSVALHAYSKGRQMTLSGRFRSSLRSPGYWTENYFSNHYVWSNSFSKESEHRIEIRLEAPHLNLEMGAYQSLATDRIYFDATGVPAQASGETGVSGLYTAKTFRLGGWNLENRVLLQWSTDHTVSPVPLASAFMAYFYDFSVVKNILHMQVGVSGWYNTRYYAFGYNPSTAQFFNQRQRELGNYILMDAFVTAKWKRMRILVKLQHANEDLWGARNYFTVLHYPLNKRVLKLGFSWSFYD